MGFLWTLEENLALRLLTEEVNRIIEKDNIDMETPNFKNVKTALQGSDHPYLIDSLQALCSRLGVALDCYLPTEIIDDVKDQFERISGSKSLFTELFLLYPGAASALVNAAVAGENGLFSSHAPALRWLKEKGVDTEAKITTYVDSRIFAEQLVALLAEKISIVNISTRH